MKRVFLFSVLILVSVVLFYFLFIKNSDKNEGPHEQPLAIGENTNVFNQSFQTMLDAYFSLNTALSSNDTAAVNRFALELAIAADSLKVNEIQGDSTGMIKQTAEVYQGTISGSARGLAGESTLEQKQREFEMISDAIWTVTRTVKYDRKKLFYMFCDKAISGKGAYWVSENTAGGNPYMTTKEPSCNTIQDSLDYSKK